MRPRLRLENRGWGRRWRRQTGSGGGLDAGGPLDFQTVRSTLRTAAPLRGATENPNTSPAALGNAPGRLCSSRQRRAGFRTLPALNLGRFPELRWSGPTDRVTATLRFRGVP